MNEDDDGDEAVGTARDRCVCARFGLTRSGGEVESGGTWMGGSVEVFARGVVRFTKPPSLVGDDGLIEVGVAGDAGLPDPSERGDLTLNRSCELDIVVCR